MNIPKDQTADPSTTEIAILLDDAVDKYHPGEQVFKLQSITGMKDNSNTIDTTKISIPNLMNKEPNKLKLKEAKTSSAIKLNLPREVTRNYPKKYIPAGTRFIVTFNSGDITKPVIVGGEFE